nr:MAG TPA: hypothetical protein [Crassvirales sp.]
MFSVQLLNVAVLRVSFCFLIHITNRILAIVPP